MSLFACFRHWGHRHDWMTVWGSPGVAVLERCRKCGRERVWSKDYDGTIRPSRAR